MAISPPAKETSDPPTMPATRADLMAKLAELGIATTTVDHPPVFTVEEARSLRGH